MHLYVQSLLYLTLSPRGQDGAGRGSRAGVGWRIVDKHIPKKKIYAYYMIRNTAGKGRTHKHTGICHNNANTVLIYVTVNV